MAKDYSKMNREELLKEISDIEDRKSYGLVWEETPEDVVEKCQSMIPVLIEDKSRKIETNERFENNFIIEGDNYHALSSLNYTHSKSVDIIYIDPPYNTGAKDWKYNNNYVDENDTFRHSKWLSMMNHRLKISKKLLTDEGSLICAIDHNEQEALGVMLEEVFPEREKVCVTIIHNPGGIQGSNFSYTHEYAYFVFPKNGTRISKIERSDVKPTPFRDWGGEESKRGSAKNCFYPIRVDKNMNIINFGDVLLDNDHPEKSAIKNEDGSMTIYPIDSDGVERKWRFARHTVDNIKDELRCEEVNGEASIRRYKQKYRWKTVWTDSKYNANIHGTQYLAGIIEEKFPYPKSIFTVEDCIKAIVHDKKDSVILDFFAGSGTTAHAVLRLNKEDGGSRRFILCTNNENKIAENITYPRVKNVIDGYNDVEGIPANLRYYKTEFVDVGSVHSVSDKKKVEITYKAGGMIALREDTLEEIEKNDWWQIFTNKRGKVTAIYFKENKDKLNDLVKQIKRSDDAVLYIFSWGKNEYKNEFTEYKNIRVEDIPEPILEVYKEINKK